MKALTHNLTRFLALSPADKRALMMAAAWLPLFWMALHTVGLSRFQGWLSRTPVVSTEALTPEKMRALGKLVNIAARRTIGPANCLTRSLLLHWLLHRKGVHSQLRIGARVNQGVLNAHAWVEFEGSPINDSADVSSEFPPFGDLHSSRRSSPDP